MSTIVCSREDEALRIGETELTDAQLAAVCGAWDGDPHPDCGCDDDGWEFHKNFEKKVKIHFEFSFEKEVKKEENFKKYWNY